MGEGRVGEEPQGLAPFHRRFFGYLQYRSLKILNQENS